MFDVVDSYPGDAHGGADFFTSAAQREIADVDDNGETIARREKVVASQFFLPYQGGRVCLSETTVRHIASLIGLYEGSVVAQLERQLAVVREERGNLSENLASAMQTIDELLDDHGAVMPVYITPDGAKHASEAAAIAHMNGDESTSPAPMNPDENPLSVPEEVNA